jgi:Tol biopolymer transport system component
MRMAAVACVVAAVAVIASNWAGTHTSGAALAHESRLESSCSPGNHVAQTVRHDDALTVNGKSVSKKFLKKGDWIRTNPSGTAAVCFPEHRTLCLIGNDSLVRVRPPKKPDALLRVEVADEGLSCRVNGRLLPKLSVDKNGKFLSAVAPTTGLGLPRRGLAGSSGGGNPVFSLVATKNHAVLKMHRGAGVITSSVDPTSAVVVVHDRQAGASVGTAPQEPTKLKQSAWDRSAFHQLDKTIPPNTDHDAPSVDLQGPHNPSSLASATFMFRPLNEPAVFSCALDDAPLHVCASPFPVAGVAPGCHVFILQATDVAGNSRTLKWPWAVDGSRIAFESFGPGNSEVFTMTPQGDGLVRVTNDTDPANLVSDEHPTWAPGGTELAFDRLVAGNRDIWAASDKESSTPFRLTTDSARDFNPAWSPDGTKIAFESDQANGNVDIWVMDANGINPPQRLTTAPAEDVDPAWSPDSKKIVFASARGGNFDIWVMDATGANPTQLTTDPQPELGPSWSKDGSRIAYASRATGNYYNLFAISPNGGTSEQLTTTEADDTNPSWAPDNEHIVFESARPIPDDPKAEMPQLYLLDLSTGAQTRLSPQTTPKNALQTRLNKFAEWGPAQAVRCPPVRF